MRELPTWVLELALCAPLFGIGILLVCIGIGLMTGVIPLVSR